MFFSILFGELLFNLPFRTWICTAVVLNWLTEHVYSPLSVFFARSIWSLVTTSSFDLKNRYYAICRYAYTRDIYMIFVIIVYCLLRILTIKDWRVLKVYKVFKHYQIYYTVMYFYASQRYINFLWNIYQNQNLII